MSNDKRIIEIEFPVDKVSGQGAREISGIHTWWARRPLGPSRATAYAALLRPPQNISDELIEAKDPLKQGFIAELSKWENALKPLWIEQARRDILDAYDGKPPKVLDPFGGGGSIPLEAQRLGCETYSCDLNPVAVLIQKCTLEYPQRYGKRLYDDVKKWGEWVLAQVESELEDFYPKGPDGSIPFAYIWARTLPCQNLLCNANIPLIRSFWLAKGKIALLPYENAGSVAFRIVGMGDAPIPSGFDPADGTVVRAVVTCPLCKSTIPASDTRHLFQEGFAGEQMLAVVTQHPNVSGKRYRLPTESDFDNFSQVQRRLVKKRETLSSEWEIDPVPDEPTPEGNGGGAERFVTRCPNYNMHTYGALFNARQQLVLVTLAEKIREAYSEMRSQGYSPDDSCVVVTYLGLWLDQVADNSSNLCMWINPGESLGHVFSGPGLAITWDYAESNALRVAANRLKTLLRPIKHLVQLGTAPVTVKQVSATNLPYSANTFDAVLTDPPYYDNIPYAYLADFFSVWLKRSIGHLHPCLFKTDLTPKDEEIVAYGHREGGLEAGKQFFEENLAKAFTEMYRVLKPDGIAVIVYAHKSTSGWETLINALLDSGLVITAAWAISTELKSRLWAMNVAALASSIYMVARKSDREPTGLYRDVRAELEVYLKERFMELWQSGIAGPDLFIATIGNGIEVFGKYAEVIDDNDETIRANRMLKDIQQIVATEALGKVSPNATPLTRFYLLWRQQYGEEQKVAFDDANQLAFSAGIDLEEESGEGCAIRKQGASVRLLGPHERDEFKDGCDSEKLIDILHYVVWLWGHGSHKGNREAMIQRLALGEIGLNENIWNVAQTVSLSLPIESQERRWLDGWLAVKEVIKEETKSALEKAKQTRIA